MTDSAEQIKGGLDGLFEQAEREGLWFYHYSLGAGELWFSPDELRDEHNQGRFIWGAVNWLLRDPQEKMDKMAEQLLSMEKQMIKFSMRIANSKK